MNTIVKPFLLWVILSLSMPIFALTGDTYYLNIGQIQTITLPYSVTSLTLSGQPIWTSNRPSDLQIISQGYSSCKVQALNSFFGYAVIHCEYYYNELDPTTGRYIYGRSGYIDYNVFVNDTGGNGGSSSLSLNATNVTLNVDDYFYLMVSGVDSPGKFDFYCPDRYGRVIDAVGYNNPNTFKIRGVGEGNTYITISSNGQSVTCWFTVVEPNSVDITQTLQYSIKVKHHLIEVSNLQTEEVMGIYDGQGRLLKQCRSENGYISSFMPTGLYLIKIGKEATKICVP